jgi:membrane protein
VAAPPSEPKRSVTVSSSAPDPDALVTSRGDRGRDARWPRQLSWAGWKDVLRRVFGQIDRDNVSIVAAGVAFYAMVSIFPLLGAAVATYGLVASRATAEAHIARLYEFMPGEAAETLARRVESLVATDGETLGAGLLFSLGFALFSGSRGIDALFTGIHIAYDEKRRRAWWAQRLLALGLTVVGILGGMLMLFLVAVVPPLFEWLHLGGVMRILGEVLRFLVLLSGMSFALAVLYRYGPKRTNARWRWLSPGAFIGSVLWLIFSYGFSFYVTHWGDYEATYGAIGGVIVLMIWLYISAFAVLLGAEIDAELEHQTFRDTTVGRSQPIGERGAVKADTLGVAKAAPSSFEAEDD